MGLIVAVDPYSKLGINVFNFETKAVAFSRENKFRMLESSKNDYEAFILGSSSAHRYHTSTVEKITGYKTFNYAVQQTVIEDYYAIIKHILENNRPKLILLQIDFYALNTNYPVDPRFYESPLKDYLNDKEKKNSYVTSSVFYNNYLTLDALFDTMRVIYVNMFGEARHVYKEHGNYIKEKDELGKVKVYQFHDNNYVFDKKRIKLLREIKMILDEKDIELIVFTSPRSFEHVEKMLKNEEIKKSFTAFQEIIKNELDTVYNFTSFKMQNYDDKKFFKNSTHPSRLLSDKIMQAILSRNEVEIEKYGEILTNRQKQL